VIGAGPYGLSLAARLPSTVSSFRIFGSPMETWVRHMPDGMFLKSEGFASNIDDPDRSLTLARFCAESGREYGDKDFPIPLETFVAYGRWFQQNAVPSLEEVEVTRVARNGSFTLELASGETVRARSVVLATGIPRFAHVPPELGAPRPGRILHTSEITSFETFAGQKIAVVGAGQSALEVAGLLSEHGAHPNLIVRNPSVAWNPPSEKAARPLLRRMRAPTTPLGHGWKLWACSELMPVLRLLPSSMRTRVAWEILPPAGAWWLHNRVEQRVPVSLGNRITHVAEEGDGLRITLRSGRGERDLLVDRLIAGTGYRVSLERLDFIAPELRTEVELVRGAPRLSAHFESTVRNLHFVGLAAANTFGPSMRFVCGTGFAARRVARHLASQD
jgi:Pyridine nucleotide-disulphide oxidoreductase